MNRDYFKTPFGWVEIRADARRVEGILFVPEPLETSASDLTERAKEALEAFLMGKAVHPLPFPCAFASELSRRVLDELAKLSFGEVVTYSELGRRALGVHQRAVARVMASNKIVLLYPCHRVVAQNGLGGYSGGGVERKKAILEWEKSLCAREAKTE
ncbi:methylated-DNA--[protein]-cysteine S-methyltransferase [Wolinella succinogenes]|uniref:methylated-DNA--[protein]-cysteine S-methyltransferase n=1 Tax=Wolinella succinogenes TaxID=844 RepID=UPI002409487A|nr:MGMT family protein [Wolinella succinogenes]